MGLSASYLQLQTAVLYEGQSYKITDILHYQLGNRVRVLYQLMGPTGTRFFEPAIDELGERALWLTEIPPLDIDTPPPKIIDWRGKSYLQTWGSSVSALSNSEVVFLSPSQGSMWRYRTAGDEYLQIEQTENRIRMFAGPSVHKSMIETSPET